MKVFQRSVVLVLVVLAAVPAVRAAEFPAAVEGDYVVRDFTFASGETLPSLRLHYRTIGTPQR
ncbi:MAG: alpha/beta fold hydrolase, partial [Vicinamibacterales bacterium]